jgi:seryl-tRNA synthetase
MLPIKNIIQNPQEIIDRLSIRNIDATETISKILKLDEEKRNLQKQSEDLKAEQNKIASEVGLLLKNKQVDEAEKLKLKTAELKKNSVQIYENYENIDIQLNALIVSLPNTPDKSVPRGKGSEDNLEVKNGGKMPNFNFEVVPHWDLIKKYDIIDFELGTKLTGAGFPVYKGKGAKLQRALINFFLDQGEKAGYREIQPPIMVNEASGFGTGQLPDKEAQMYVVTLDNFYLIPTAEVPVTNIYRDVILDESEFPVKNMAYTPCFRREAGSYGKDVKGLNRLHQFDKVEIVQISHPDKSYETLEEMVLHVESLVKQLGLPYRILKLCGGDMGFTSALTYDFEVFSAAQGRWLEVSSVSNFEDFQANRLKLRFKSKDTKKTQLAHTLNGSALALPRIVAAILENNQTPEGIKIPECLIKYTGFDIIS